jgi:hypothetical protein
LFALTRCLTAVQSIAGPALASDPGLFWEDGNPRRLYLAWTDADGHMFTSYCRYSSFEEFADSSHICRIETDGVTEHMFTSPSVTFTGNALYIGWPGTDDAHRINFMKLAGPDSPRKVVLGEFASSAIAMQPYESPQAPGDGRYAYRGTDGVGGL